MGSEIGAVLRVGKTVLIMKTENGVGCLVDNSLFWQALGMGNIWVDMAENI